MLLRNRICALLLATFCLLPCAYSQATPPAVQPANTPPRVLIVVAHPDDESCFAATVYEITHNIGGTVDQLVITDGEGGYRYSLLAEPYYGVALTNEAVGRAALPEIRKRELLNAGKILGIANHFFLDEKDVRYTQDVDEVLNQHWHAAVVLQEVKRRMEEGKYDFVLTLFPTADTHGGHKAATLTAIAAAQDKDLSNKPVVLGCQNDASANGGGSSATPLDWSGFKSPLHPFAVGAERFAVDRDVKFGFKNVLSYQIIVNWVIAEHKSQGAFQMDIGRYNKEEFAILDTGTPSAGDKAGRLFNWLNETAAHPLGALSLAATVH